MEKIELITSIIMAIAIIISLFFTDNVFLMGGGIFLLWLLCEYWHKEWTF